MTRHDGQHDVRDADVVQSRGWAEDDAERAGDLTARVSTRSYRLAVIMLLVANAVVTAFVWWELRAQQAEDRQVRCIDSVLTPQRQTPLSESQRELALLLDCPVPAELLQP